MTKNVDAFIEELKPWLSYIHIADNMGEHDDHLAFGDGTVDWPRVLELTAKSDFNGPYVIEFPEKFGLAKFAAFQNLLTKIYEKNKQTL
jgi:sugar phosphate isomerase/epimerase